MSGVLCTWVSARIVQDRVEPHLAANKDLEATCTRLRQRCEQLERENSTLALALAYRQVSGGGGGGGGDDDATAEVPS